MYIIGFYEFVFCNYFLVVLYFVLFLFSKLIYKNHYLMNYVSVIIWGRILMILKNFKNKFKMT